MNKGMKKAIMIIGAVVLILGIAFIVIKSKKIEEVEVGKIDLHTVKDGDYSGEYNTNLVKVKVSVKVINNTIKEINIIEHQNGLGKKAETITDKIIKAQSLQVDSVSGATASSNVIKKAVEDALRNEEVLK